MRMHTEQNMQKLRSASIEDTDPARKAKAFVIDVIVIEGPACYKAVLTRYYGDNLSDT